jgi:hypothetical protein
MKIDIKNYRSCGGNETDAFSCILYLDGKKAAEVSNDGNGGMNMTRWLDRDLQRAFLAHCVTVARPIMDSWSAGLPDAKPTSDETFAMYCKSEEVIDVVVNDFLGKMAEEKQLKRLCKTKVVFRLKGDRDGEWRGFKADWTTQKDSAKARLVKDFGDQLAEIANERFS